MAEQMKKTLLQEGVALSLFLETLLREPQPEASAESAPAPAPAPSPLLEVVPTRVQPVAAPPEEEATAVAAQAPAQPESQPDWAEEEFQALLFKAGGLRLAVPLVALHGIVEWHEDITPMPGHADFYLGLLQHQGKTVPVIDTASFVLPPDKRAALTQPAAERCKRIILIDDARWGLACDEVERAINLRADQVRWRSQRTARRWLAGTVIEHMCALLDATAFGQLLARGWD